MFRVKSLSMSHELLAATLARYSRSNSGIDHILSQIDNNNEQASIEKIFKFVDYGHASIGGLTNGIPIVMDNVSMFLAYKIFEISQMSDGQESSTRYITLNKSKIPSPHDIGIPTDLHSQWYNIMSRSFDRYNFECKNISTDGIEFPSSDPKVINRMKKNYVLDRTRYYIPFATMTNIALIQNARMWTQTIRHLASMPQLEARLLASYIRAELRKYTPRLIKHSYSETSYIEQCNYELEHSCREGLQLLSTQEQPDNAWIDVNKSQDSQSIEQALQYRSNRYGYFGSTLRRMRVVFGWNNIALAELRDLNRHRTGNKYTPLIQTGFYTGCARDEQLLEDQQELLKELMERRSPAYVYALLLGSQTPFEHSTHADKFIYEAELRTGLGAHYKYAQHMSNVLKLFYQHVPEASTLVKEGSAEPE